MAILKPGPLGTVSGKIAGTQFAVTRARVIVSQPVHPKDRATEAQLNQRSILSRYARYWKAQEMDSKRPAWEAYALTHPVHDRLGNVRYLSGYQWFLKFLPMMVYYDFHVYDAPFWSTSNQITGGSIYIDTSGVMRSSITGTYDTIYTKEFIDFARFAPQNHRTHRLIWRSLPAQTKSGSNVYYTSELAAINTKPVLGERWSFRVVWQHPYQPPTPPYFCSTVASS